ncbi:MAG TPA: class I SAM-dependent methyltransferase [Oligoflexia bacterium]|nr:class I SAM-dependent methyltransferase [Oligoflexia bacterium]
MPIYTFRRKLRELTQTFNVYHYQQYMSLIVAPTRKRAFDELKLTNETKLLEVGVGNGSSLEFFPAGIQITGIDFSATLIEQARIRAKELQMSRARFYVMNAQNLRPLESNSFDAVVSLSLLSVVPEPEKAFSEMVRVCRPGGKIAVTSHFLHKSGWRKSVDQILSPAVESILGYHVTLPEELIVARKDLRVLVREDRRIGPYVMNSVFVVEKLN